MTALLLLVGGTGCQELKIDSRGDFPDRLDIDAQESYEIVATSPRPIVFNISSNVPWNIESDASWCVPSPGMSSTSSLVAEITVKCQNNETEQLREATLTVKGEGLEEFHTIKVRQDAKGLLEVQPIEGEFSAKGGQSPFTITSNREWRVVSSRQWLTFDKTSGEGTGQIEKINAICEANGDAVRTTIVTVSNGSENKSFEVTQKGSFLEFIPVEEADLKFDSNGQTRLYEVDTNLTDWDVTADNTFATVRKTEEGKVEVTMPFNNIFIDRKSRITLSAKNGMSGFTDNVIEVSQGQNFNAQVTGSSHIDIDPETGAATLNSPSAEQCRFSTKLKNYQLGRYTWTFSEVEVSEGFWIDANFYHKKPQPRWELYMGANTKDSSKPENVLKTWADKVTDFNYKQHPFTLTLDEVKAMRKLVFEIKKVEGNDKRITMKITLNDRTLVDKEMDNPFITYPKDGTQVYFGFFGQGAHTPGKIVLKSFDIERY